VHSFRRTSIQKSVERTTPTSPLNSSRRGSSVHSDPRSDYFNQNLRNVEFIARYTPCPVATFLPANYGGRPNKSGATIVATSASSSGDTLAIVEEYEYRVYRSFVGRNSNLKPKCVGRFDLNGLYRAGLDGPQARSHGYITDDKKRREFICAATSDNLLAIGASKGTLFLFSIGEGEQSLGKMIFYFERADYLVQKILFNPSNTELVVLSSHRATNTEVCQFYAVSHFPIITTSRRQTGFEHNRPCFSSDCELSLDMSYRVERGIYPYRLRDAKFSSDGRRLIAVTSHIHGSAMVFSLFKDDEDRWTYGGSEQIAVRHLDNWDDDCLGFTGISLYTSLVPAKVLVFNWSLSKIPFCYLWTFLLTQKRKTVTNYSGHWHC